MKINCECNNEEAQIRWVRGNTQPLAIPLEQEVMTENEEIRTEPYYPSESDKVTVYLVGRFKRKAFTPEIDGNVIIIREDGTLSTGSYHVEVLIEHQDGTRNRSLWCNQVVITESNDTVLEEWDEFKQQEPQARAAIFFFAKGDKGDPFTYEDFTQEQIEDLKKPAVDAAAELTAEMQALESEFTESENERVANENQRKANEIARVNAETSREVQSASDHTTALADHTTSVDDHTTAQSDHTTALSDNTQASSDHVTANGDHTRAESDHALAATDHTTATSDHHTAVQDNAQMTELVERADADHVQAAADHDTAESDHTTATSDHAQAATDHNAATSDHDTATSDHATASTDHSTAQSDHTTATNDHDTATIDHQTAVSDHSIADGDHTLASADHTTAQSDHAQAASDHTRAENDNATATSDHTTAVGDHTTAAADHTQAVSDHTTAAADHTTAESDHAAVEVYVDSLGAFDLSKHNAVGGVLATYADLSAALTALNALDSKYKYGGMSFKFVRTSDNKYMQARCMAQNFTTDVTQWQGVDDEPTAVSNSLVKSGGVAKYTLEFPKPATYQTIEWNLRFAFVLAEKQFLINKVYKLKFSLNGCNETDISKLDTLVFAVENNLSSIVYSYLFTESDKIKLETDGYCDIIYCPSVSTSYVGTIFGDKHIPGQTKSANLAVFELIDSIAAFEGINNGEFADKSPSVNSNKLITSGAVYNAAIVENTNTVTFTVQTRTVTDINFDVKKDDSYTISVGVSGLSNTDIDNIQRIRLATGTAPDSYKFEHMFTNEDKDALKTVGFCKISYNAEYDTSYIHLYFVIGYTPTSGNSFTIGVSQKLTCSEVSRMINEGVFADKVPIKNSTRLITSGAVFDLTNITGKNGEVSFVMVDRYNLNIQLQLHKERTYELKLSVEGLSNIDIDNLRLIRIATGTGVNDYVYQHLFTNEDKTSLKNDGYCLIPYSAEQDTYYIHFYFNQGYTPTEGNKLTIEAYSQYTLIEAFNQFNQKVKGTLNNFLEGKTCVCIGDSITEFAGRGEGIEPKRYSDYLEEYCNMTTINIGIGGTCLRERHDPVIVEPGVYHISDYGALDMINIVRAACGVDYDENHSYLELAQIAAEQIRDYKPSHDNNTAQIARLAAIDWSKVDYVTVLGGSNDWHGGGGNVLGESGSTNTATTLGAINEIIRLLLTTYPHITLIWITPPVRWIGYIGTEESKIPANFSDYYKIGNLTLKEFSNSIKNEVGLNHTPVFDFYNEIGWNMYNFAQYYGDNETHPFRGNAYIARKLANFLYSH